MAIKVDDPELIKTVKAGDPLAFTHLVGQYREALFRHAMRRLHDPSAAEDAVQETFFRAYRAFDRLRDDSRLGPWLHQILSNVCVDEANRRRRASDVSERAGGDPTAIRLVEPSLEEQLGLHVDAGPVRRAMDQLPDTHQEAFTMRVVDQLDYGQIAAASGTSEQNARARVSRARSALRLALRGVAVVPLFLVGLLRRGPKSAAAVDRVERVDHVHRGAVGFEAATGVTKVATSLAPAVETATAVAMSAQHTAPLVTKAAIGIGAVALAAMSAGPERPAPVPAPVQATVAPTSLVETTVTPTTGAPPADATLESTPLATAAPAAAAPPITATFLEVAPDPVGAEDGGTTAAVTTTTAVPETSTPASTAPETTVPATTAPETTVPATTIPETTVPPPTTSAPVPSAGTLEVSGMSVSPAGPRLDVAGAATLAVDGVAWSGSLSGRVSISPDVDASGRQRLDGVLTLSADAGTLEVRLAGHATATDATDATGDTPATSFTWSGAFRASGAEPYVLIASGSFSGSFGPGGLGLRLAP